jgi:hypothetical protein
MMDFGLSLTEAIAAPRISQRNGGITQVDSGLEQAALGQELTALGHVLEPVPEIGAATGITIAPDGRMIAAAEPVRRGGGSAMTVSQSRFVHDSGKSQHYHRIQPQRLIADSTQVGQAGNCHEVGLRTE